MEVEHCVKVIPLDENLQATVKELEQQGYDMVPGVVPVVVYHLVRVKGKQPAAQAPAAAGGGFGDLKIDDSKIHVVRDGQVVN